MTGHLHETLVEREVVADGVLPSVTVLAIEGKVADDELVDAVESETLARAAADRHHYHRVVAVRWFLLAAERGAGRE